MKRKFIRVFFIMLAAFIGVSVQTADGLQTADSPDSVIRELYRIHDRGNGALLDRKSRAQMFKFFDRQLFDLFWTELTSNSDEVGNLDFDPFYNAQDVQITAFTISKPTITRNKADVAVTFRNAGRRERLSYKLNRVGRSWKISNILYADGSNLIKILSAPVN